MSVLPVPGRWYRLRAKVRWWRHTLAFQLAHGPLCERHRGHVVHVGDLFVCRSCLCLYGGVALTLAAALVWRPGPGPHDLLAGVGLLALPVLLGSLPLLYRRAPRWARDLLRWGAGVMLGLTLAALVRGAVLPSLAVLASLLLLFAVYGRVRLRGRPRICEGCPELGRGAVCSGYAMQAERIRRYEDEMSSVLARRLSQGRSGWHAG